MARARYLVDEYECPCCQGVWLIRDYTDGGPTAADMARFHVVCPDCRDRLPNRRDRERFGLPLFMASHMLLAA